mgnify:CR=1 FL=1
MYHFVNFKFSTLKIVLVNFYCPKYSMFCIYNSCFILNLQMFTLVNADFT